MIRSLVFICIVAAGLLSWVYSFTKDRIEEDTRQKVRASLVELLGDTMLTFKPVIPDTLWEFYRDTTKLGIIFRSYGKGYGGPIPVLVALSMDTTVLAIRPATPAEGLKETPGLGTKITEPEFTNQFKNKKPSQIKLKKDGGEIDAITGATISSRGVVEAIQVGIAKYLKYLR